jgi:hypothetical protein
MYINYQSALIYIYGIYSKGFITSSVTTSATTWDYYIGIWFFMPHVKSLHGHFISAQHIFINLP